MGKRERRRARDLDALRARGWRPILTGAEQREVDRLIGLIEAEGYRFEWVEWIESAESPGFLGMGAGITIPTLRVVRVRTREMTGAQIVSIVAHELEHVLGAEWATDHEHLGLRCGGRRNGFGDRVGSVRKHS